MHGTTAPQGLLSPCLPPLWYMRQSCCTPNSHCVTAAGSCHVAELSSSSERACARHNQVRKLPCSSHPCGAVRLTSHGTVTRVVPVHPASSYAAPNTHARAADGSAVHTCQMRPSSAVKIVQRTHMLQLQRLLLQCRMGPVFSHVRVVASLVVDYHRSHLTLSLPGSGAAREPHACSSGCHSRPPAALPKEC